jgi:predicted ATPase
VLNRNAKNEIIIGIHGGEKEELTIFYEANNEDAKLWLTTKSINKVGEMNFPILRHEVYYLNAERLGPRIQQNLQHYDFPNAGWQGENTAQLIGLENGYLKIDKERRYKETRNEYLEAQVNNWLDFVMPGVKVKVRTEAKTLSAQVLLENTYTTAEPTLATNLGFGISYVLPIIATGLIAARNSYFIVENPEAHLHPSAQSKIGEFLAFIANAGVNVIIETHSDHIINGIQIATAKKEIVNDLVTINYFSHKEDLKQPDVQAINISSKGELSDWPSGFFDQSQIDYAVLFNQRKK